MTDPSALHGEVVRHLQAAHALKAGALRMFDPMLAAVAAERHGGAMAEVSDLLARMHGVFSGHREDEEMAATINRNWVNVLSLTLASRRLPTLRPPEAPDAGGG